MNEQEDRAGHNSCGVCQTRRRNYGIDASIRRKPDKLWGVHGSQKGRDAGVSRGTEVTTIDLSFEDVNFLDAALDRVRCNSSREELLKRDLRKRLRALCSY